MVEVVRRLPLNKCDRVRSSLNYITYKRPAAAVRLLCLRSARIVSVSIIRRVSNRPSLDSRDGLVAQSRFFFFSENLPSDLCEKDRERKRLSCSPIFGNKNRSSGGIDHEISLGDPTRSYDKLTYVNFTAALLNREIQ